MEGMDVGTSEISIYEQRKKPNSIMNALGAYAYVYCTVRATLQSSNFYKKFLII